MKNKAKIKKIMGILACICLLSVVGMLWKPVETQAATKKISKSDFVCTEDNVTMDFYSNTEQLKKDNIDSCEYYGMTESEMKQWNKDELYSWSYFTQFSKEQKEHGMVQLETSFARGIKFGDKASKVAQKYGKTKKISFKTSDAFHNDMVAMNTYFNADNISYYYEYKLEKTKYAIRFYFTKKDVLQNVAYVYNIKKLDVRIYKEGGKLPVSLAKGQSAKKKSYAGRTYYEISKNAKLQNYDKISTMNAHYEVSDRDLLYSIIIIDNEGNPLYESAYANIASYYFDGKTTVWDSIYGDYFYSNTDEVVEWDEIEKVIKDKKNYLYICLYIIDQGSECGKHGYVYRFKLV